MSEASIGNRNLDLGEPDGGSRRNAALALALALILAGTAGGLAYTVRDQADPYMIVGLGVLAFIGLFGLFAAVAGLIRFTGRRDAVPVTASVLDTLEDACALTDASGRLIYANRSYRSLAGTGGGALPGIETLYAGHPEIAEHIYRLVQAAEDGTAHAEPVRLMAGSAAAGARADRTTWLKISVRPVEGDGGSNTLWRLTDISDDRKEQEGAFLQLQHIIDYLDHAPAGFFSTNAEGGVEYVNATLAGWLNLDLGVTTGGTLRIEDIVGAEGVRLLATVEAEPGAAGVESFDLTLAGADARSIPVRIVHRVLFDAEGKAAGSQSLLLDHRVETMPRVRGGRLERRFARFFNSAPIGIALLNGSGEMMNTNGAFVRIVGKAARRGRPLESFVAEADRAELATVLERAHAGQLTGPAIDVTFAGEGARPGQIYLSPLEAGEDEAALIAYVLDRSEQHALEQQFTQSQKMQAVGQLAGGVAHDFNNVLTAIIGFSDLLLARHRPTDPSFQEIMNIKQNANRAANLVRQLLAFSRQQTLRPEVLSLKDVISDLGNLLSRLLGEKIELKTDLKGELWPVRADLNQFEQVIINLAVNARDAMPDGGTLTIRTANVSEAQSRRLGHEVMPPADYVLCEVSDTGIGMAPEVLAKIYEPFFSTKEVGKGTGLGLSTVYGIVKQTDGFVFCDSAPGRGTAFRIYLPRHMARPETAAKEKAAEEAAPARADLTGAGTVLLVEDEEAVRAFASKALASRGYTVLEAGSGGEALELLDKDAPEIDLVVSDVVMPGIDGPALVEELKKRDVAAKVIFISGYAEDTFRKTLAENDDIAFLPKPFSLKQLAAAVKKALTG